MIRIIIDPQLSQISHSRVDTVTNQNLLSRLPLKVTLLRTILTILGKVEKENVYKPKNHTPSKMERRNTQKQLQKNKKEEQVRNIRFFAGARGAAKIVVSAVIFTD